MLARVTAKMWEIFETQYSYNGLFIRSINVKKL